MLISMGDLLGEVRCHLPRRIASDKALSEIGGLARRWTAVGAAMFELRLAPGQERVDFAMCWGATPRDKEVLALHLQHDAVRELLAREPLGPQVHRLCTLWTQQGSLISELIERLCLEFDADDEGRFESDPSVFIGVGKMRYGGLTASDRETLVATNSAMDSVLDWSGGATPTAVRCLEELPGQGRLVFVGSMLPRGERGLRLCVSELAPEQVVPYLTSLGWTGAEEALIEALSWTSALGIPTVLNFDVAEGVLPKLGLELFFQGQHPAEEGWRRLLDDLVRKGMCEARKAEALLSWPGFTTTDLSPFPGQGLGIYRMIDHLKLVVDPDGTTSVKAYPHFGPAWVRSGGMSGG